MARAVRAIVIKADGAVSVHSDSGNKPLNYMGAGSVFSESMVGGVRVWRFETSKENLTINLHSVLADTDHPLAEQDEGLVRDGTEAHLRDWLAENTEVLGPGCTLIQKELRTIHGPVDLVVRDAEGNLVAVEVKRTAMLATVGQVQRYVEAMLENGPAAPVRGMIAALDVRPKTMALASRRGIECVTVDPSWNGRERGGAPILLAERSGFSAAAAKTEPDDLFGDLGLAAAV